MQNPNYPMTRGCFIDRRNEKKTGIVKLVDYPTYHMNEGHYTGGSLDKPMPKGAKTEMEFKSVGEARKYAAERNFVVCEDPWVEHNFPRFDPSKARDAEQIEEA